MADEKSREVRLGLVMYGGVSLAIYINGVAQEFFRAVRGRGVYKLIKALSDSDVIVDIISGTSAGGINGILLSYALCNERDFSACSSLWRRDADIRSLLRSPYRNAGHTPSMLNSEGYFQPRLEAAFREMPCYVSEIGEDRSEFSELDLFVTGTDVDGNIFTQFDDRGHPIDVKDHRSVFLLKHRQGRKEPFNPFHSSGGGPADPEITYQALAKLARITSCFPAAFTPVHTTKAEEGDETPDGKLQMWGKLGKEACFIDGGVLDNKPFTYTIKEIFHRTADRDVERILFYVEPDPERFVKPLEATQPNFFQTIIAALIGIPGYESISDDLKLLAEHNSELVRQGRLLSCLEKTPITDMARDAKEAIERARKAGSEAAWDLLWEVPEKLPEPARSLYRESRLIQMSERAVQGVLREDGRDVLLTGEQRAAASRLIDCFDHWEGAGAETLRDFDIYVRLRRLFYMTYLLKAKLYDEKPAVTGREAGLYRRLWSVLNRQIKLLEVVRTAMEGLIDEAEIEWQDREADQVWQSIQLSLQRLMNVAGDAAEILPEGYAASWRETEPSEWLTQEQISHSGRKLKERADRIKKAISKLEPPETFESLLCRTDLCEQRIFTLLLPAEERNSIDPIREQYDEFVIRDAQMFPIELVARLHEKDVIKTVRISPLDAQKGFSSRAPVDKVSGDVLHHFGGFFKRSWRSNDILWGRLDGLCELVESLLRRERFEAILADDNWRHEVRDCLFVPNGSPAAGWAEAMTPALLFPHAGAKTQTNIGQWLVRLFSDIKKDREEALASFDRHVELIIEAAQLEVLHEDLPMVITDALEEQALWNQFRVSVTDKERESKFAAENLPEFDAKRGVFRPGDGDLDPLVVTVAAEETAKSALEKLQSGNGADAQRPAQTKLGTFFTRDYKVGSEALLKDMPRLVLLEILASSLLVLRNCILGVLGPHAEKVKRSPLYILALECPLRSFQALVLFLRRAPRTWRAIQIGLALLSILALVVGITWWSEIIYPGEFFVRWFVIFIALPLLILVSQCVFLWGGRVRDLRWMRVARDTVIALLLLTPLIPIVAAFMGLYRTHGISLVEMCILYIVPFVAPFVGGWLACRLGKYRRAKPKELQHALEEYFSMDDMKVIEKRLGLRHIPSLARMWTASEIVRKAAEAGQLAQLESAMRSINPESLM